VVNPDSKTRVLYSGIDTQIQNRVFAKLVSRRI
jgi:hypothetical protein